MSQARFETWHRDLQELLGLAVSPVAIAFIGHVPAGVGHIARTMPPPTADGRTGAVAGRILDRSHARRVRHDRGGPRQLQRRLPDAWFQDHASRLFGRETCGGEHRSFIWF